MVKAPQYGSKSVEEKQFAHDFIRDDEVQLDIEPAIRAAAELQMALEPGAGKTVLVGRYEVCNPVPFAPPLGHRPQPGILDRVRDMIRSERLRQEAEAAGYESFEDGDDFEIGDDYDPTSPYEYNFEPPASSQEPSGEDPERSKPPKGGSEGGEAPAKPKPVEAEEEVPASKK